MEVMIIVGVAIVAYVVVAFIFPEWVGITGKTAKKNLQSHTSGKVESTKDEVISKLDK